MTHKKVDGVEITLNGEKYTLPPLPLVRMPKIKAIMEGGDMSDEFVDTFADAIHWSLLRNHPDLDRGVVADNLDMTNWKDVLAAFMKVNGFEPNKENQPSGEAPQVVLAT